MLSSDPIWAGVKGDLTLYLVHIEREPGEEEPALYIRNERIRVDNAGCRAFLVPYKDFWMFRPEDTDRGQNCDYADMQASLANASVALYGLDVREYRFRVHDAILDFADDVKNLRPPSTKTQEQWERELDNCGFRIRANGERIR